MDEHAPRGIAITLSPTQIDEVVRAAADSRAPSLVTVITDSLNAPRDAAAAPNGSHGAEHPSQREAAGPQRIGAPLRVDDGDRRLSRSLLRGLSLLTRFGPDGAPRGIVELAGELGMSPSTAHRYALTLVEVGLLERCPKSRKYRLPGTAAA